MEPNKLESQFKEQLNSREINPSEIAWSKLDAMLTIAEKPKVKFPQLLITASFAGFLLVATIYFNQNVSTIENQKNKIVIQNSAVPKTIVVSENTIKIKEGDEKGLVANVVAKSNYGSNRVLILKEKQNVVNYSLNQNQVAQVSIINQKTIQKSIKSQTSDVTVDELLAVAGNPSKKENQLNQKPVAHVNASNLLSQVEGELELSFREKVINKVTKNYQTVKVALTNRNLEQKSSITLKIKSP